MAIKKKIGEYELIKKFMQLLKKPTIPETIRLHRLHWFGDVQRMEEYYTVYEFGNNSTER
jgi:hypothetical protein